MVRILRVLLRARVKYFSNWGLKILVSLLYDPSTRVAAEALDFLDEACEDKVGWWRYGWLLFFNLG